MGPGNGAGSARADSLVSQLDRTLADVKLHSRVQRLSRLLLGSTPDNTFCLFVVVL